MHSNPGVLWFNDFDGCNYKISFGAASVLEVGGNGFICKERSWHTTTSLQLECTTPKAFFGKDSDAQLKISSPP